MIEKVILSNDIQDVLYKIVILLKPLKSLTLSINVPSNARSSNNYLELLNACPTAITGLSWWGKFWSLATTCRSRLLRANARFLLCTFSMPPSAPMPLLKHFRCEHIRSPNKRNNRVIVPKRLFAVQIQIQKLCNESGYRRPTTIDPGSSR